MGKVTDKPNHWLGILVNLVLIVFGATFVIFWPSYWESILSKELQLRPGTILYNFWKEPPQPLYIDIYFFNWTNPHDVKNASIKPNFEEVGPYRFQEFPQKVNVSFHDANSTMSYRKQSGFKFLPDQSKGRLTDLITSVNIVALSSANQAKSWNILKLKGVEISLSFFGQEIHLTKNASELLFEGYSDPIIKVAREIGKVMGIDVPFDKFGWFYGRNESSILSGHFNIHSGADDISKLGVLERWNYKSKFDFYDDECSSIRGSSAGEFFPPKVSKDSITIFSSEMCRNVILDFSEEVNVRGIPTYKFIGSDRTTDNGTKYPENKCFCSGECLPSGVLNITACRLGAPVIMSFPHFYNADKYYLNQVTGMKPNRDKHEFFLALEPKTSLPVEVAGRFQLNVLLSPIKRFNMYKDLPERKIIPVVWFEQYFKVDRSLALQIRIVTLVPLFGQIFGFLLAILGIFFIFQRKKKCSKESQKTEITQTRIPEISPLMKSN